MPHDHPTLCWQHGYSCPRSAGDEGHLTGQAYEGLCSVSEPTLGLEPLTSSLYQHDWAGKSALAYCRTQRLVHGQGATPPEHGTELPKLAAFDWIMTHFCQACKPECAVCIGVLQGTTKYMSSACEDMHEG